MANRISIYDCMFLDYECLSDTYTNSKTKLSCGTAGQFYLTAEITVIDFYLLMLGKRSFAIFNPRKVIEVSYRE